ncbi:MAG: M2 family metallopeptidase [Proteobacteria bacterium]|nr:M2 family metallopeptidase [Pseudomonadota bacterium]
MKTVFLKCAILWIAIMAFNACSGAIEAKEPASEAEPVVMDTSTQEDAELTWQARTNEFLEKYFADLAERELTLSLADWKASNSGSKEDFEVVASAKLAYKKLHSDPDRFNTIEELLIHKDELEPGTVRSLEIAFLEFKSNLLPKDILEKTVKLSTEIERIFNTFRGELHGKKLSNNDLLEIMSKEKKTSKRKEIWETLKQVGVSVGPKLIELAKMRNEAAKKLGYVNFWDMKIRLQEHDPDKLLAIFNELEGMTDEPFKKMKTTLDKELAKRFEIKPREMMPWHYDNPFFQAAPPSAKVNLDDFYKRKKKEDIVELARKFYTDIGLPSDDIIARSDLYEREGKSQHAFFITIDRNNGDMRVLLNIKPTADWMRTTLHELGHAVYNKYLNYDLPFNLRSEAHMFTTEGIAMLFGDLARNPTWLIDYAGVDAGDLKRKKEAILEQQRREQLIFARWTMVMLYFEKSLYENPDQNLNKLWWDNVERFQMLKRPKDRDAPDWASKLHFSIFPVYYHNYMLGALFAAQLRDILAKTVGHRGPNSALSFSGRKEFGEFLKEKIFKPGVTKPWPDFVKDATGEVLSAKYFVKEIH